MIPFRTPFLLPLVYPRLVWRQPQQTNTLYLTFDDGPVPGPTEFVLETLQARKIPATFFCIGDNVHKHPDVFKRILANQHAVGNHTFNHLNGWKNPLAKYVDNVNQCGTLLANYSDELRSRQLFRPPYGRITFAQIKNLSHYHIVMWDVLTHDYNRNMSGEYCLRNSIKATRNGSIVVFHDSVKAEANMQYVLPRYIDHFASLGYQFKVITS